MGEIKTTVVGICISALLIGFFLKLAPKSKLNKNMKHLLSMVILLIVITPLSGNYNINWSAFGIGEEKTSLYTEDDYKNRVIINVASIIKGDVEDFLTKENIGFYAVGVNIIESDGSNEVLEIVVHIKSGYSPIEVENSVKKKFDLPCKAIIGN